MRPNYCFFLRNGRYPRACNFDDTVRSQHDTEKGQQKLAAIEPGFVGITVLALNATQIQNSPRTRLRLARRQASPESLLLLSFKTRRRLSWVSSTGIGPVQRKPSERKKKNGELHASCRIAERRALHLAGGYEMEVILMAAKYGM